MGIEYDIEPKVQFTPFSAITQVGLYQLVAQALARANKGLWIFGTSAPDITANPRYASYCWLDASAFPNITPKYWNGSAWTAFPAGNINSASQITDGIITAVKLANGTLGAVLRANPSTGVPEWKDIYTVISDGSMALVKLAGPGSGTGHFLRFKNGTPVWDTLANVIAELGTSNGSGVIDPNAIGGGAANTLLNINSSGLKEWVDYAAFFQNRIGSKVIPVSALAQGSATSGQVIGWNGSNWAPTNIGGLLVKNQIIDDASAYLPIGDNTGANPWKLTLNHTLGAQPKIVRVVVRAIADHASGYWATGNEWEAEGLQIMDQQLVYTPAIRVAVLPVDGSGNGTIKLTGVTCINNGVPGNSRGMAHIRPSDGSYQIQYNGQGQAAGFWDKLAFRVYLYA